MTLCHYVMNHDVSISELNAHGKQHPAVSVAMVEAPNQYTSVFEDHDDPHQFLQQQHEQASSTVHDQGNNGAGVKLNGKDWGDTAVNDPDLDCIKPWELEQTQTVQPVVQAPVVEIKEPIDEEVDKYFKDNDHVVNSADHDNQKLSQLRNMLVKNLKSPSLGFKPACKQVQSGKY